MTLSLENLDNITFDDLVKEALARIPVYALNWTNVNKADPGITLIELLAHIIEMQIYSLNRINTESYLKFLKILGIPRPYPASPAEIDITFHLVWLDPSDPTVIGLIVPAGTMVAGIDKGTGKEICYQTVSELEIFSGEHKKVSAVQGKIVTRRFDSDGSSNLHLSLGEGIVLRCFRQATVSLEDFLNNSEEGLKVKVNGELWSFKEDLDSSKAGDKHFTADLINGIVIFGDGVSTDGNGAAIPPVGEKIIKVTYRSGVGSEGNLKVSSTNYVLDGAGGNPSYQLLIEKVALTEEGKDAETLEDAIERAKVDLRTVTRAVTRAVTALDYEQLAIQCPDVKLARVKALPGYYPIHDFPINNAVSVAVIPVSDQSCPTPTKDQKIKIYEYMNQYRMLGTELFIIDPLYVRASVEVTLVRDLKFTGDTVMGNVKNKLYTYMSPLKGGVNGKGWPFGRSVYLSEIYKIISDMEGVNYVAEVKLKRGIEDSDAQPPSWTWIYEDSSLEIAAHALVYVESPDDCSITVLDPV